MYIFQTDASTCSPCGYKIDEQSLMLPDLHYQSHMSSGERLPPYSEERLQEGIKYAKSLQNHTKCIYHCLNANPTQNDLIELTNLIPGKEYNIEIQHLHLQTKHSSQLSRESAKSKERENSSNQYKQKLCACFIPTSNPPKDIDAGGSAQLFSLTSKAESIQTTIKDPHNDLYQSCHSLEKVLVYTTESQDNIEEKSEVVVDLISTHSYSSDDSYECGNISSPTTISDVSEGAVTSVHTRNTQLIRIEYESALMPFTLKRISTQQPIHVVDLPKSTTGYNPRLDSEFDLNLQDKCIALDAKPVHFGGAVKCLPQPIWEVSQEEKNPLHSNAKSIVPKFFSPILALCQNRKDEISIASSSTFSLKLQSSGELLSNEEQLDPPARFAATLKNPSNQQMLLCPHPPSNSPKKSHFPQPQELLFEMLVPRSHFKTSALGSGSDGKSQTSAFRRCDSESLNCLRAAPQLKHSYCALTLHNTQVTWMVQGSYVKWLLSYLLTMYTLTHGTYPWALQRGNSTAQSCSNTHTFEWVFVPDIPTKYHFTLSITIHPHNAVTHSISGVATSKIQTICALLLLSMIVIEHNDITNLSLYLWYSAAGARITNLTPTVAHSPSQNRIGSSRAFFPRDVPILNGSFQDTPQKYGSKHYLDVEQKPTVLLPHKHQHSLLTSNHFKKNPPLDLKTKAKVISSPHSHDQKNSRWGGNSQGQENHGNNGSSSGGGDGDGGSNSNPSSNSLNSGSGGRDDDNNDNKRNRKQDGKKEKSNQRQEKREVSEGACEEDDWQSKQQTSHQDKVCERLEYHGTHTQEEKQEHHISGHTKQDKSALEDEQPAEHAQNSRLEECMQGISALPPVPESKGWDERAEVVTLQEVNPVLGDAPTEVVAAEALPQDDESPVTPSKHMLEGKKTTKKTPMVKSQSEHSKVIRYLAENQVVGETTTIKPPHPHSQNHDITEHEDGYSQDIPHSSPNCESCADDPPSDGCFEENRLQKVTQVHQHHLNVDDKASLQCMTKLPVTGNQVPGDISMVAEPHPHSHSVEQHQTSVLPLKNNRQFDLEKSVPKEKRRITISSVCREECQDGHSKMIRPLTKDQVVEEPTSGTEAIQPHSMNNGLRMHRAEDSPGTPHMPPPSVVLVDVPVRNDFPVPQESKQIVPQENKQSADVSYCLLNPKEMMVPSKKKPPVAIQSKESVRVHSPNLQDSDALKPQQPRSASNEDSTVNQLFLAVSWKENRCSDENKQLQDNSSPLSNSVTLLHDLPRGLQKEIIIEQSSLPKGQNKMNGLKEANHIRGRVSTGNVAPQALYEGHSPGEQEDEPSSVALSSGDKAEDNLWITSPKGKTNVSMKAPIQESHHKGSMMVETTRGTVSTKPLLLSGQDYSTEQQEDEHGPITPSDNEESADGSVPKKKEHAAECSPVPKEGSQGDGYCEGIRPSTATQECQHNSDQYPTLAGGQGACCEAQTVGQLGSSKVAQSQDKGETLTDVAMNSKVVPTVCQFPLLETAEDMQDGLLAPIRPFHYGYGNEIKEDRVKGAHNTPDYLHGSLAPVQSKGAANKVSAGATAHRMLQVISSSSALECSCEPVTTVPVEEAPGMVSKQWMYVPTCTSIHKYVLYTF